MPLTEEWSPRIEVPDLRVTGVGGQIAGGGEVLADDLGEDLGLGTDPEPWHGIKDEVQRVESNDVLLLTPERGAGCPGLGEHAGEFEQDDSCRVGSCNDDALGCRRRGDVPGPAFPRQECVLAQQGADPGSLGPAEGGRRGKTGRGRPGGPGRSS